MNSMTADHEVRGIGTAEHYENAQRRVKLQAGRFAVPRGQVRHEGGKDGAEGLGPHAVDLPETITGIKRNKIPVRILGLACLSPEFRSRELADWVWPLCDHASGGGDLSKDVLKVDVKVQVEVEVIILPDLVVWVQVEVIQAEVILAKVVKAKTARSEVEVEVVNLLDLVQSDLSSFELF